MPDTTRTHVTPPPGADVAPPDQPRASELRRVAEGALLVALMLDFLAWISTGKEVSRERLNHPYRSTHYTLVTLGRHLRKHEEAGDHVACPFDRGAELLTVALKAHILKLVPERTERRRGDVERQHGWVIPGPDYRRLRHDALHLVCVLLDHAPTLWRLQDPRVFYAPAEQVMRKVLARLMESGGDHVSSDALWERVRHDGVPIAMFPGGIGVLSALGVIEHREVAEAAEGCERSAGTDSAFSLGGFSFALTPVGTYAVEQGALVGVRPGPGQPATGGES
ncbi:hypothetical protein [Nocardiopsis rhodophaea]|uniref:hypothetical protein n=1 Tax=Nocardiopsis rhodophaea TaxID=280238 RepID=UPI0031D32C2B